MEKTITNKEVENKTSEVLKEQKLYKIRIYKDFEFPSFSIDKNKYMEDLYFKSLEEVSENFHKNENYFNVELSQILPFSIKTIENSEEEMRGKKIGSDFNYLVSILSVHAFEQKYGVIDYKKNPDIFDKESRQNMLVDVNSSYSLNKECEAYYIEKYNYYSNVLKYKFL